MGIIGRQDCLKCGPARCFVYRPLRSVVRAIVPQKKAPQIRVTFAKCICKHGIDKHINFPKDSGPCGVKRCTCDLFSRQSPPPAVARKSAPARTKRKLMPKCRHCAHPYSRHATGPGAQPDPACSRCASCPGYEPKRKTRSDKKPIGMRESDLGKAKRTLWAKFRAYIYRRDGNVCFTCDRVLTDEDIRAGKRQAGHMFPGRTGALLFDPLVVFVQDAHCNKGLCGNTPEFVRRYVERFGIEQFQAAVARTSRDKQWRTHEVRELIAALNRDPSGAEYEALYMEKHGLAAPAAARGIE
jgi:hypothetical protein